MSIPASVGVVVGLLIVGALLLLSVNSDITVTYTLNPLDCFNGGGVWSKGWCFK